MRVGILAFSQRGLVLGERLGARLTERGDQVSLTRCGDGGLHPWTKERFPRDEALIFIGSVGLAVRAVAPYIKSKTADPAVVVVDELGQFSISLLSGHLGGANRLAAEVAELLGAAPVITTATDLHSVFAVDTWAGEQGLVIANPQGIEGVSARLLAGETLRIASAFPIEGPLPRGLVLTQEQGDILISYCGGECGGALLLVPPVVNLGIGCKKGTAAKDIEGAFLSALAKRDCHPAAVRGVCSIDLKAGEPGILEFCRCRGLPYCTFSARELAAAPGSFSASAFVTSVTGVDNVCERSAVLGSGPGGRLLMEKSTGGGIAMALAMGRYSVRFGEGDKT